MLAITNTGNAFSRLDDDEKSYIQRTDVGLNPGRDMVIINEPGLYRLILRSSKPQAKAFKRWVTHEVLPQIRKTGGYIPMQEEENTMTEGTLTIDASMTASTRPQSR